MPTSSISYSWSNSDGGNGFSKEWILWESMPISSVSHSWSGLMGATASSKSGYSGRACQRQVSLTHSLILMEVTASPKSGYSGRAYQYQVSHTHRLVWWGNGFFKEWILWENMPTSGVSSLMVYEQHSPYRVCSCIKCIQCHDIIPAINPPWRIPWGSHDWYLCTCLSLNLSLLIKQGNVNMYLP